MAVPRRNSGRIDGISPYRGPSGGDPEDYLNTEVSPFHAASAPSSSAVAPRPTSGTLPATLPSSAAPISTPSGLPAPTSAAPSASPGVSVGSAPLSAAPRGSGGVSVGPFSIGGSPRGAGPIGPRAGWGYGLGGDVPVFSGNVSGGPGQFGNDPLGEFGPNVGDLGGPTGAVLGPSSTPDAVTDPPPDSGVIASQTFDVPPQGGAPAPASGPAMPAGGGLPLMVGNGPLPGGRFGGSGGLFGPTGSNYQSGNDPFYVGSNAGPDIIGAYYGQSEHPIRALTEGEFRGSSVHDGPPDGLGDFGGGGGGPASSGGQGSGHAGYENSQGRFVTSPTTQLPADTPGWTSSSASPGTVAPSILHHRKGLGISPSSGPFSIAPEGGGASSIGDLLPALAALLRRRHSAQGGAF